MVAKFYANNGDHFAITRNYNSTEEQDFYLVAVLEKIPEKESDIRKICGILEYDVKILQDKGLPLQQPPLERSVIDKTKEVLKDITQPAEKKP